MELFKQPGELERYGVSDLTDEELIANFNICINYKAYLHQIMGLPDKQLLMMAPGNDVKTVRENLKYQEKFCNDYIEMWQKVIKAGGVTKLMN